MKNWSHQLFSRNLLNYQLCNTPCFIFSWKSTCSFRTKTKNPPRWKVPLKITGKRKKNGLAPFVETLVDVWFETSFLSRKSEEISPNSKFNEKISESKFRRFFELKWPLRVLDNYFKNQSSVKKTKLKTQNAKTTRLKPLEFRQIQVPPTRRKVVSLGKSVGGCDGATVGSYV